MALDATKGVKMFYQMLKSALLALIVFGVSGCMTIRTNLTTFHGKEHFQRGTIEVVALTDEQKSSLAFQSHSALLLDKLQSVGYRQIAKNERPEFIAYMTYGIDTGKSSTTVVPLYGQTGGGTSMTTGNISSNFGTSYNYNSTTTQMPTYGMIGAIPVRKTEYTRELNIDIYKVGVEQEKVYEIRGKSAGSCGNINVVLPLMIESIFKNFPGVSGKSQSIDIEVKDLKC